MNYYHLIGTILLSGSMGGIFGAIASLGEEEWDWVSLWVSIALGGCAGIGYYLLTL